MSRLSLEEAIEMDLKFEGKSRGSYKKRQRRSASKPITARQKGVKAKKAFKQSVYDEYTIDEEDEY